MERYEEEAHASFRASSSSHGRPLAPRVRPLQLRLLAFRGGGRANNAVFVFLPDSQSPPGGVCNVQRERARGGTRVRVHM